MRVTGEYAQKLASLVKVIWPEHTEEALSRIILDYINTDDSAVFTEKQGDDFIGVTLCCLRHDYVEGCETSPVGYLEGVSVREGYRKQGVAKRLVAECEQWARDKGCLEFASDCELANTASLNFHLHVGFQEENRIICFRKNL